MQKHPWIVLLLSVGLINVLQLVMFKTIERLGVEDARKTPIYYRLVLSGPQWCFN